MGNSQESVESKLIDVLYDTLDGSIAKESITEDTALLDGGLNLDSIILLRLLNNIEAVFGLEVDDDDFTPVNFANVKSLADYVRNNN